MTILKKLFVALTSVMLLQGCAKTYEIHFNNLSLLVFQYLFDSHEILETCTIEVRTKEDFNAEEYAQMASGAVANFKNSMHYEQNYPFLISWDATDLENGIFYLPISNGRIKIYDDYTHAICLELTIKQNVITSLSVWKDNKLAYEATGELFCDYETEFPHAYDLASGTLKTFKQQGDVTYLAKEQNVEREETDEYDKSFITTKEYYPTGQLYHIKSSMTTENNFEEDSWSEETLQDTYYNEDGSEMTIADRLFQGHEKYIVLDTGWRTRAYGDAYFILMPGDNRNDKGYGALIYSKSDYLSRIYPGYTFEYRIEDSEIVCDEFFSHRKNDGTYHSEYLHTYKRMTLAIIEDEDNDFIIDGNFYIIGDNVDDCQMEMTHLGHSNWLYKTLQKHIDSRY